MSHHLWEQQNTKYFFVSMCSVISLQAGIKLSGALYTHARLRITHFMQAGVVLTNAIECSNAMDIRHAPWKKRKQIKEKAGMGQRSQTE